MQVEVKHLDSFTREIKIIVPWKELEKSFKKVTRHLDIDLTFEKIKKNVGMIIESNISIRIINDKNPITDDLEDFWNLSNYHIIIGGN